MTRLRSHSRPFIAEKSEKNIDAKIIALSFTVFGAFLIEKCEFYSQLIEEYKKKLITSIVKALKTVKDRAMIFASIIFSDFSAMNCLLRDLNFVNFLQN